MNSGYTGGEEGGEGLRRGAFSKRGSEPPPQLAKALVSSRVRKGSTVWAVFGISEPRRMLDSAAQRPHPLPPSPL